MREDEWLWGWDPTPGIVSVWAEGNGVAAIWRRNSTGDLVREIARFRPWLLLSSLDDLSHVRPGDQITYRELTAPGELKFLVSAEDMRVLTSSVLLGASRRVGRRVATLRELGQQAVLALPPNEQYLVSTGRNYFRGLTFDQLRRMQFDLETTGLDAERDRIFMIAIRYPDGATQVLEDADEARLIRRLADCVRQADPDVIENHNLHGFDLPFLDRRAALLGVQLSLGRIAGSLRRRAARRGIRFVAPGRELIDTLDAVLRYDFATRDLPEHGLKAVARHLGVAKEDRQYIPGPEIYKVYQTDPERVRRYATGDVEEVAEVARLLGGAAFALARMAPRRYERLADAGAATGIIDPLLVRAYLRAGMALPAHQESDGTPHSGAALHLFACGVAKRIVKADVASLYPSLMRAFRIGPKRDHLGAMLALVDRLVTSRLEAKRSGQTAFSAAVKLVINSAYGYLGAGGGLTRFADVHAANEVTRRGRETLHLMCTELAARGVTLLEADTDGVYFAVPDNWTEADERRVVAEVGALLPPLVHLEFEGRYAAMLSHEPKNYALLTFDGKLILKGVAFRSSRAEPFGEAFLRKAIDRLLNDDIEGVRDAYLTTLDALRKRELSTYEVSSKVKATNSRTYRTKTGVGTMNAETADLRDYDVAHYSRLLLDTFATRLKRAFTERDFGLVFADPDQMQLFAPNVSEIRPILTRLM